jgi:hypothetical protein
MAFEIHATRQFQAAEQAGDLDAALSEIQQDYDAVLAAYCAPSILNQQLRAHFGDPPTVDPERTRIESVSKAGRRIVVATVEDIVGPPPEPDAYEYVLERADESLRIADRRTRDLDGRWIHNVV